MTPTDNISAGQVLIAEPFMGDSNFERAVILVCEHNNNGSFGLVLNQVSKHKLHQVIEIDPEEFPLFIGGPVQTDTLHFIHRLGHIIDDSIALGNGIYWSGNFEMIKSLTNIGVIKPADIRFFLGYSGWGRGQLQSELDQNTWMVSDITATDIFDLEPKNFWRQILKNKGGDYKVLSNYPTDPRLN